MTLTHRTGDIFTTDAPAIGHGVNTQGVMGAGIAAQFKARFPEMYDEYVSWCADGLLDVGGVMTWHTPDLTIYNIASQDLPGANARLDWLAAGVEEALRRCELDEVTKLALPQIGCGIGGLDWDDVLPELEQLASESPVDVEVWTYGGAS